MVVIEIDEPNRPPVALNDSFTVMCYPLTGDLLYNDYDPDRDNIYVTTTPVEEPQNGSLTLYDDGSFVYMPDDGFIGVDSFVYEICDDGLPSLCDEALVWIKILPDVDCGNIPEYDEDDPNNECNLFIPDGFSPNGDGVHDFFQIFCIDKYPDAVMRIFDRAGNKLFEKRHYGNLKYWGSDEEAWWWGKSENKWTLGRDNLPAGNYLYVLELGNGEVRTGTVMIAY
jgi:gliding motility-associated-like protein